MIKLLSTLHASGLGHDAVIEILIALLGVMVAVLTLIAAIFSVGIAIMGVYGFQTIREEAKKKAESIARTTAKRVAKEVAGREVRERAQASGLSESQAGELKQAETPRKHRQGQQRVKATSDKGLSRE